MNSHHFSRIKHALGYLVVLGLVAWLVMGALSEGFNLYTTPSSLDYTDTRQMYLGGRVVEGSLSTKGNTYQFDVADAKQSVTVVYQGTLPSMFKEGRDTIIVGQVSDHQFNAKKVLAKHDEYYRPRLEDDS